MRRVDDLTRSLAWPETLPQLEAPTPTLSPYLAVPDARGAIGWYAAVFDAKLVGDVYEDEVDGHRLISHASLAIGDSILMLAEASVAEEYVAGETGRPVGGRSADSLSVRLPDVDAALTRAAELGAEVTRPPRDEPYGRTGALVDPFGRRWLVHSET